MGPTLFWSWLSHKCDFCFLMFKSCYSSLSHFPIDEQRDRSKVTTTMLPTLFYVNCKWAFIPLHFSKIFLRYSPSLPVRVILHYCESLVKKPIWRDIGWEIMWWLPRVSIHGPLAHQPLNRFGAHRCSGMRIFLFKQEFLYFYPKCMQFH